MYTIVHVSEALGTGVVHLISQLAISQLRDGFRVVVIYSRRPETPSEADLDRLFPPPIERVYIPMVRNVSPLADCRDLIALARSFRRLKPDAIHLHSSKAGVLGRVAAALTGFGKRTFYSPQGFAFLRSDVSAPKRRLYLMFERLAAFLQGTLVACSASEERLACDQVLHPRVVLVENSAEVEVLPGRSDRPQSDRVRVVTSGRLSHQKAPWRFRDIAVSLHSLPIDFIWVGGGELERSLTVPEGQSASLQATGWVPRSDVAAELSRSDIFLMTSLWEGMPVSLIEAQAAGLPAVVPDIVGCRDIVKHGETGFVCKNDEHLASAVRELVLNAELRQRMGRTASEMCKDRFSVDRMHREMLNVYGLTAP